MEYETVESWSMLNLSKDVSFSISFHVYAWRSLWITLREKFIIFFKQARNKTPSRLARDSSRESPSRSSYLPASSSSSSASNYYSMAGTSSGSNYMTIPEIDENKNDFYLQKTRARDITKRRGAIKLIQRLTFVYSLPLILDHEG